MIGIPAWGVAVRGVNNKPIWIVQGLGRSTAGGSYGSMTIPKIDSRPLKAIQHADLL
ncbi:hypothetical protein BN938_2953 [Mucinivorans hirudinis]|uniref:Uncharacterized protein n=1 Tax=Mucinivorans hirudinis TaxID=1433126 RepID=A0A060REE7_9BACT|nr:hypothetical protein BN938_2953 [Mucinivorans hirudinis]